DGARLIDDLQGLSLELDDLEHLAGRSLASIRGKQSDLVMLAERCAAGAALTAFLAGRNESSAEQVERLAFVLAADKPADGFGTAQNVGGQVRNGVAHSFLLHGISSCPRVHARARRCATCSNWWVRRFRGGPCLPNR